MNPETYTTMVVTTCGAVATIGLYSVLYRETKLYRFFEHMFLGLAAGYSLVAFWKDTLYENWWKKMTGQPAGSGDEAIPGYWVYILLAPVGLMAYTVFSKKHSWMSRVPIGIILGMWSGQQILNWWRAYGPQIADSMRPIFPTNLDSFTVPASQTLVNGEPTAIDPATLAQINASLYPTQALSNLVFVITVLASLSYFIFSYEIKGKVMEGFNTLGRWLLMIGFGAIFGATVMARFALVIDRLSYILNEWLLSFFG